MIVLQQEEGEKLMLRRELYNPKKKVAEEPKEQKKVFKARCKVQGKCCNLIIDQKNWCP